MDGFWLLFWRSVSLWHRIVLSLSNTFDEPSGALLLDSIWLTTSAFSRALELQDFTNEPPTVRTLTVMNYDLLEVSKAIRALFMGLLMTGFMHFYLKFTQPLLVSSLTVWISLWRAKVGIFWRGAHPVARHILASTRSRVGSDLGAGRGLAALTRYSVY